MINAPKGAFFMPTIPTTCGKEDSMGERIRNAARNVAGRVRSTARNVAGRVRGAFGRGRQSGS